MSEAAHNFEGLLREALAPVEPPADLAERLEHTLTTITELAAAVTARIWACVNLQWEWLGGVAAQRDEPARPGTSARRRRAHQDSRAQESRRAA